MDAAYPAAPVTVRVRAMTSAATHWPRSRPLPDFLENKVEIFRLIPFRSASITSKNYVLSIHQNTLCRQSLKGSAGRSRERPGCRPGFTRQRLIGSKTLPETELLHVFPAI